MQNKGQLSMFIIMGILLLLVVSIYFALRSFVTSINMEKEDKMAGDFATMAERVNIYTGECVKNFARDTLDLFGAIGTTLEPREGRFMLNEIQPVAYLRVNDKDYLPAIEDWQKTITQIFNGLLVTCNYSTFQTHGIEVTHGTMDTTVTVGDKSVDFKTNYPIHIAAGPTSKEYMKYSVNIPVRLGYIHGAMHEIISKEITNPGFIPLSVISQYDLGIMALPFKEQDTSVYYITDRNPKLKDPYYLFFADKDEVIPLE